jgi:hypothetical protein
MCSILVLASFCSISYLFQIRNFILHKYNFIIKKFTIHQCNNFVAFIAKIMIGALIQINETFL